jgi:hypothetical protein
VRDHIRRRESGSLSSRPRTFPISCRSGIGRSQSPDDRASPHGERSSWAFRMMGNRAALPCLAGTAETLGRSSWRGLRGCLPGPSTTGAPDGFATIREPQAAPCGWPSTGAAGPPAQARGDEEQAGLGSTLHNVSCSQRLRPRGRYAAWPSLAAVRSSQDSVAAQTMASAHGRSIDD